jgi:hypothetical protein
LAIKPTPDFGLPLLLQHHPIGKKGGEFDSCGGVGCKSKQGEKEKSFHRSNHLGRHSASPVVLWSKPLSAMSGAKRGLKIPLNKELQKLNFRKKFAPSLKCG